MDIKQARSSGALAGMFLTIAAWGCNWLITRAAHPDSSSVHEAAVLAQVFITAALGIWFWRRGGQAAFPSLGAHTAPSA